MKTDGSRAIFTARDGLAHDFVTAVHEDREGSMWIGTRGGVTRIRDGKLTSFTTKDGLTQQRVTALHQDRAGRVWIGTDGGGLNLFAEGRISGVGGPEGAGFVRTIHEDRDGNLWLGTQSGGLCRFRDGKFFFTREQRLLPDTTVQVVYEDREGNLWVGTRRGGLVRLKDTNFTTYSTIEELPDDHVYVVHEEPDGGLWIGTRGGLTFLKDGKSTTYTRRDGLSHNSVRALYKDGRGDLWIGTYGAGLNRFRNGKFTTHGKDAGVEDVVSIFGDGGGNLWIASTVKGLMRFSDGKFDTGGGAEEPALRDIRFIYADRANRNVWFATRLGLVVFNGGKFRRYTERDGLSSSSTRAIYEDAAGDLWVGTNDHGLNRFRDGKFTAYTSADGLFDDAVYQIQEDRHGNLWVGSRKGIYRVRKKEFDDLDSGRTNRLTAIAYGVADGMRTTECTLNGRVIKAPNASDDLLFPTIMGLVRVDPTRINSDDTPPHVLIEEVVIDKRPVDLTVNLNASTEAPPGRGDLEVHYTSLSFAAPERVRFKYMLDGFDREWVDAGTRRMANYTNLPPGSYRFRVTASDGGAVWDETGASFGVNLRPHFYQTYTFFLLCAAAVALIGWQVHRARVRRMETQFALVLAERTRIARELHDTLLQGFAGIAYSLKAVANIIPFAPQAARQHLERTLAQVNNCLTDARRSVWDLRSDQERDSNLSHALTDSIKQLTANHPVKTEIRVDDKRFNLPRTVENHLLRIGQEAVANAVKHARPEIIKVELSFDDRCVMLSVRDDGSGFDEHAAARRENHFGLLGMRERVKQIGGQLTLHSNPEDGTEVLVIVPIR